MRTPFSVGFVLLLVLATGCGKGGGGGGSQPTATDPNAPVIANLRATFDGPCTISSVNLPGTRESVAFDYVDADGNVRGGRVENSATFSPFGGRGAATFGIPSTFLQITGTTSGTITMSFCTRFGSNTSLTEQVQVFDASGKASNVLTVVAPRPAGLPLLPQGADPTPRRSPGVGP